VTATSAGSDLWLRKSPSTAARDRKGLYAKAREGLLPAFTGLTDPYEPPGDADLVIDMTSCSSEQAATTILRRLRNDGCLAAMPDGFTGTEGPEHLSAMA
jgi:adenylylsulfate kinase-like enzyme